MSSRGGGGENKLLAQPAETWAWEPRGSLTNPHNTQDRYTGEFYLQQATQWP